LNYSGPILFSRGAELLSVRSPSTWYPIAVPAYAN